MKFIIILVVIFSALPVFSQEKTKKNRTCRVIFLERPNGAPKAAHIFDGKDSYEVMLSTRNLSREVKLPAGDLTLGMTPNAVVDPESFPEGAPTVKVAASISDFYLVVVSDPKNKVLPVRMMLMDVSEGKLRSGQTLWINFSKYGISGELGKESLIIAPKSMTVGKSPLRDSGYYKASFKYKPNSKSKYLPVMKKSWWFDATSKHLGFIVDSGGKLPKIFMFRDRPVPEPDKPEE